MVSDCTVQSSLPMNWAVRSLRKAMDWDTGPPSHWRCLFNPHRPARIDRKEGHQRTGPHAVLCFDSWPKARTGACIG
jgi:hypothetical protein